MALDWVVWVRPLDEMIISHIGIQFLPTYLLTHLSAWVHAIHMRLVFMASVQPIPICCGHIQRMLAQINLSLLLFFSLYLCHSVFQIIFFSKTDVFLSFTVQFQNTAPINVSNVSLQCTSVVTRLKYVPLMCTQCCGCPCCTVSVFSFSFHRD